MAFPLKLIHNLPRLLRTLRPLRPVQVWRRVWMRLCRPRVDPRPASALRPTSGRWHGCARAPSMLGANTFRFLNIEHTLEQSSDWNRSDWPRLWLYNLHYFDDLAATGVAARTAWHRALIARWIEENPPPLGTGWDPYPTSLRIVNWAKWALAGSALDAAALHSLAIQTRWLRKRLEFHLLGNHLWANAKALVFAGAFFDGEEAARWFRRGMALVKRELTEQILPDGGHFERSPMYHAIVLEDLLDLIQISALQPALFDAAEVNRWRDTATRMLRWLRVMTHPDGGIALFNDAALGIAPDYEALATYAQQLGVAVDDAPLKPIEALPDSGYVRLQAGDAVLIADVGEIGPTYLPGHAHADTLSFELSLHGERVLVNGGTSTYENNAERLRQRGTAAHNTVVVNGENSSEVWAAFRVGRRAHPLDVAWGEDNDGLWLRAAHDGFAHLRGHPIHHREWRLSAARLTVHDRIAGACDHAEALYRFTPGWYAASAGVAEVTSAATSPANHIAPSGAPATASAMPLLSVGAAPAATSATGFAPVGAAAATTSPANHIEPSGAPATASAMPLLSVGAAAAATDARRFASAGAAEAATGVDDRQHATHGSERVGRDFELSSNDSGDAPLLHVQTSTDARVIDATCHPGFSLNESCTVVELPVGSEGAVLCLQWQC